MITKELRDKEIQKVLTQIVEKYHPLKVILFGSAADEAAAEVNDLDFLIIMEDVPEGGIDRLYEINSLVDRGGFAVDMLVYTPGEIDERIRMGDPFVRKMVNEGRLLYG
ncbi:MAG: nucleotidyltransferase domain-containing protein [Nitrospirae bacterium]|nr:nucleotidyltransferase domain-containing protein [Nitrospirota bacterium]